MMVAHHQDLGKVDNTDQHIIAPHTYQLISAPVTKIQDLLILLYEAILVKACC